ncbi:hypothetical protein QA612_04425 [Evansella sp. AB-P1]|nr:hypothetical protein [Evansella sp. AB-P1]MDG5786727.1 hypothetical protein [Evansella sp. AB-P1]
MGTEEFKELMNEIIHRGEEEPNMDPEQMLEIIEARLVEKYNRS